MEKISKKTVVDTVATKDGSLKIEIIEDTVMPSGDMGYSLNFVNKKPVEAVVVTGTKWPSLNAEKKAIMLAKKIIDSVDKPSKVAHENNLRTIANKLRKISAKDNKAKLIEFFTENKNPEDSKVHDLADKLGMDAHELESQVYSILSDIFTAGMYNEKLKADPKLKIDPKELAMGIKVEMEHTTNPMIAERIAKDHIVEISDYYTRLKKMEEDAGVED